MLLSAALGCNAKQQAEQSAVSPTRPDLVAIFPGLPVYPQSVLSEEAEDKSKAVYTTTAAPEAVISFYQTELEQRNPARISEDYNMEKRRKCSRRWNMFSSPEGLYIVKGRRALLVAPSNGTIVFERKDADVIWATRAELTGDDYVKTVLRFAQGLQKFSGIPEEREQYSEKLGLTFGASLQRLRELTPVHSAALIAYLIKHPDFKEKGMPAFLKKLEFWETIEASTTPGCESPLQLPGVDIERFKLEWQQ